MRVHCAEQVPKVATAEDFSMVLLLAQPTAVPTSFLNQSSKLAKLFSFPNIFSQISLAWHSISSFFWHPSHAEALGVKNKPSRIEWQISIFRDAAWRPSNPDWENVLEAIHVQVNPGEGVPGPGLGRGLMLDPGYSARGAGGRRHSGVSRHIGHVGPRHCRWFG